MSGRWLFIALLVLGSATEAAALPKCAADQAVPANACYDTADGQLCLEQYQPYKIVRTRAGKVRRRNLDLCRYQATLTTRDARGKSRIEFSHSYAKQGDQLVRQPRAFAPTARSVPPASILLPSQLARPQAIRPDRPADCANCSDEILRKYWRKRAASSSEIDRLEQIRNAVTKDSRTADSVDDRFFASTNERRQNRRLAPLARKDDLNAAADEQCRYIADQLGQGRDLVACGGKTGQALADCKQLNRWVHIDAEGKGPLQRAICRRTRCSAAAENAAILSDDVPGQLPERALLSLMTSAGHRHNILGRVDQAGDFPYREPTARQIDAYPLYDPKRVVDMDEYRNFNQVGVAHCQVACTTSQCRASGRNGQYVFTQFFVERR